MSTKGRTFTRLWLVLTAALLSAWSAAAFAATEYKPNEILVKYKDGVRRTRTMMEQTYQSAKALKVERFEGVSKFEHLFTEEGTDIKQAIAELEKNPAVEYAQPNYILHAYPVTTKSGHSSRSDDGDDDGGGDDGEDPGFVIPCIPGFEFPGCVPLECMIFPDLFPDVCNEGPSERPPVADKPADVNPPVADPDLSKAWGVAKAGAPEAWTVTRGSQDIVVAVIDTGVDYNHEDLAFNMWRNPDSKEKGDIVGWDFVHNDNLPYDDNMHGTHCSGSIGAVGGNGKAISGISQRVSIMALKFLSGKGSGTTADAIKAIDYAIAHGANILSNSWGGGGGDPEEGENKALLDAIKRSEAKGVLFVAAAGNGDQTGRGVDNDKTPTYPAAYRVENMITVAATDSNDKLASFSNYGKESVHLAAPGVDVYSSVPGNQYKSASGTSMATPHVAGAAALVWSLNPKMTYKEVKQRLLDSVDQIPAVQGKTVTGGRLNVAKAVKM